MRLVDPSRKSFLLRWQAKLADRERPVRFVIAAISNTLFGFAVYPLLLLAFEPLRRHGAADSHGERESPGLGLFIVRQVALAHGGDVSVDSADAGRASR